MNCEYNTKNITHVKGDSYQVALRFKDGNDDPINLIGATIRLTIKNKKTDADALAIFQSAVTGHIDAINGLSEVVILPSDTQNVEAGTYYYDIEIAFASGVVNTFIIGTWNLIQDVTHNQ